jgi:3-oxoadipate enol-lactonase
MGGAITQWLATQLDFKLRGILLITTGSKFTIKPQALEPLPQGNRNMQRFIANFSPRSPQSLIDKLQAFREQTSIESTIHDYEACAAFQMSEDSLSTIQLPTLLIAGADDPATPPSASEFLHQAIQGSKLVVVADAGHYVMHEQRELFTHHMDQFLSTLDLP